MCTESWTQDSMFFRFISNRTATSTPTTFWTADQQTWLTGVGFRFVLSWFSGGRFWNFWRVRWARSLSRLALLMTSQLRRWRSFWQDLLLQTCWRLPDRGFGLNHRPQILQGRFLRAIYYLLLERVGWFSFFEEVFVFKKEFEIERWGNFDRQGWGHSRRRSRMSANQNSAFKLRNRFTLEKLVEYFGLEE